MTADRSNDTLISFSTAKFMETEDVEIQTQTKGGTTIPGIQLSLAWATCPGGCGPPSVQAEWDPWYRVHQQEPGQWWINGFLASSLNTTYFLFYSCRNNMT